MLVVKRCEVCPLLENYLHVNNSPKCHVSGMLLPRYGTVLLSYSAYCKRIHIINYNCTFVVKKQNSSNHMVANFKDCVDDTSNRN